MFCLKRKAAAVVESYQISTRTETYIFFRCLFPFEFVGSKTLATSIEFSVHHQEC